MPAETLGKHYFVTRPTGPSGTPNGHVVRIYGNVDGTHLSYPGGSPGGAPGMINAGDVVVDLGVVNQDFEVTGDHEFIVSTFMLGAGPISNAAEGDPSQSFMVTVEQYRLKYIFLAPDDYDTSYVDIVQPVDAKLTLDEESARRVADSDRLGLRHRSRQARRRKPGRAQPHVRQAGRHSGDGVWLLYELSISGRPEPRKDPRRLRRSRRAYGTLVRGAVVG